MSSESRSTTSEVEFLKSLVKHFLKRCTSEIGSTKFLLLLLVNKLLGCYSDAAFLDGQTWMLVSY